MTDVKRLLEQATPLPWRVRRSIHGDGYRHVQIGKDESYTTLDLEPADARLIVTAVNRLPDYEAAVDALARVIGAIDREAISFEDESMRQSMIEIHEARSALRRLRP